MDGTGKGSHNGQWTMAKVQLDKPREVWDGKRFKICDPRGGGGISTG